MVIAEPETPAWWKRVVPILNKLFLQANRPILIPGYATADLPAPDKWSGCIARDTTLNALVLSDGTNWNAV